MDLRRKWESDGLILDDEDWTEVVASPREVAISARLRLVQLKILHQTYVTGHHLHKIGYAENSDCRRGCGGEGTFLHIIWECPFISKYWKGIHDTIKDVVGVTLRMEAKHCLLNVWEPTDLNSKQTIWVTLALMVAKRNIAQAWGALQAPELSAWRKDMDWCMFREKSVYTARGCPRKWSQIWSEWNCYLGEICTPPAQDLHVAPIVSEEISH